jgi:DNA-3-methyladenine glycosylase I
VNEKVRCGWVKLTNKKYVDYHDNEWGRPLKDDKKLFRLLCLEGAQAGLTWELILNRFEAYDEAFWSFEPSILASKTDEDLLERMEKFGVVKNRLKSKSLSKNAKAYFEIAKVHGGFSSYVWSFVNGQTVAHSWDVYTDAPTMTEASVAMSKSLKKYGFSFVGPTICYAYMQSAGLVSDHERSCFLSE